MSLLSTPSPPLPSLIISSKPHHHHKPLSLSLLRFSPLSLSSTSPSRISLSSSSTSSIPDEWGDKPDTPQPEPEPEPVISSDPPILDDEWAPSSSTSSSDVDAGGADVDENVVALKRCLLDSVYGSDFGLRASSEVRAEVLEIVNQLEAANPTPSPNDDPSKLDGNWLLVFTAYSELGVFEVVGAAPGVKVTQICQVIDTSKGTVENATTVSSPFATFSFSATANIEVRSPSRIQVRFKEATFKPPEIKSQFDLPESVDVFGQKITLSPVQQLLNPLQEAVASISRPLYGLPPLNVPIPGERTESWLITTYLDEDFRISRGDGGLFVLVREGSPLLDQ